MRLTVRLILGLTLDELQVDRSAWATTGGRTGRRGPLRFARAAQLTAWLAVRHTPASLPLIGSIIGRDHSTVIHALKRMPAITAAEPVTRQAAERLDGLLSELAPLPDDEARQRLGREADRRVRAAASLPTRPRPAAERSKASNGQRMAASAPHAMPSAATCRAKRDERIAKAIEGGSSVAVVAEAYALSEQRVCEIHAKACRRAAAPSPAAWQAAEDGVLRRAYGQASTARIAAILGRSRLAVIGRARRLGLARPRP